MLNPHKKRIYEAREFIEETGQESEEQGIKVTQQYFKEEELKRLGQREFFLTKLDSRKNYNDYNRLCAQITLFYLDQQDLPKNLSYKVQYDTHGVLLFLTVGRKIFQRAFRSVRDPLYDLNACQVFAFSVGDLLSEKVRSTPAAKFAVPFRHGRTTESKQT